MEGGQLSMRKTSVMAKAHMWYSMGIASKPSSAEQAMIG